MVELWHTWSESPATHGLGGRGISGASSPLEVVVAAVQGHGQDAAAGDLRHRFSVPNWFSPLLMGCRVCQLFLLPYQASLASCRLTPRNLGRRYTLISTFLWLEFWSRYVLHGSLGGLGVSPLSQGW